MRIETPTRDDLARIDRTRKKKTSNTDWTNPHDPDAKVTKMKDGRTHLAHKAEHAVDVETGAVRLLRYVAVHDSGRAINPMIVEGQLHGGVAQGIGAALMEELVYDAGGQLLTGSLMDYAVPRADDLPEITTALIDHTSVINELGVKGVGESGAIAPGPAIANAVEDALAEFGITIRELPVTPGRIFELLTRAGSAPR